MSSSPQSLEDHESPCTMNEFIANRKIWKQWLIDDDHSIQTKIDDMIFHHAVYKSLRFKNDEFDIPHLPNIVSHLLDKGYSEGQFLAIRRLCDSSSRKDYISILRILDDIKDNAELFTRYNYVCFDGAPFDFQSEKDKHGQNIMELCQKNGGVVASSPNKFYASEYRHRYFDEFLQKHGKNPKKTPDEKLPICNIVNNLKSHLGVCDRVKTIANKFYAHSADLDDRENIPENNKEITFENFEGCHKNLYAVANFIGSYLLVGEPVCLAVEQFNVFEGFEKIGVSEKNLDKMNDFVGCYRESLEVAAREFEVKETK